MNQENNQELDLWCSVLQLAIQDCAILSKIEMSKRSGANENKQNPTRISLTRAYRVLNARKWVDVANNSFKSVCEMAMVDHEWAHRKAWEFIKHHDSLLSVEIKKVRPESESPTEKEEKSIKRFNDAVDFIVSTFNKNRWFLSRAVTPRDSFLGARENG